MKRILLTAATTLALTGAALATEPTIGAHLGTNFAEIAAALAEDGYEIEKYEKERGEIELYAVRDGKRWEIEVDPRSGRVRKCVAAS